MVKFEKQYIQILNGEIEFRSGDRDTAMKRVVEYAEKEITDLITCLSELDDGDKYFQGIRESLDVWQGALNAYRDRVKNMEL